MNITYKTEGKCMLPSNNTSKAEAIAITWVNGDDCILLLQSGSGRVAMSKNQLLELAKNAEAIADNINPHMNSLPRPA